MARSTSARDTEAISAYLTDLQNQVRGPASELQGAIRALAEPLSYLGLLDATSTNGSPQWAGPISEPTSADRQHFIQHLLPNHLNFILDNITINWLSALSSAQQTALFDTYFVPALAFRQQNKLAGNYNSSNSSNSHPWSALMAVVSMQTLVTRVGARFNENHSFLNKTILRLVRRLLDMYTLLDFYRGCCDFTQKEAAHEPIRLGSGSGATVVDPTFWDSFLSKLFSIPTRVSNALGISSKTEIEDCFQEVLFFKRQAAQLQSCLDSISPDKGGNGHARRVGMQDQDADNDDKERTRHAKGFAIVVAKFLRIGYGKILVESVVSTLWNSPPSRASGWRLVLANATSLGTAQLFLTTLVKYLNEHQLDFNAAGSGHRHSTQKGHGPSGRQEPMSAEYQLAMVHRTAQMLISIGFGVDSEDRGEHEKGDKKQKTTNENSGMIEEVLFQGREYGLGVLRTLICIQTGWPTGVRLDKDSALGRTLKRTLEAWSDSMLVNHASVDYQKYVSYQLLLMIGYLDHRAIFDMGLIFVFGQGMAHWLELDNDKRKQIALIVAEEFARVADPIGSSADFSLDNTDPEVQFTRSLVQFKDGTQPYNPSALVAFEDKNRVEGVSADIGTGGSAVHSSGASPSHQIVDLEDEEEDPDEIVDPFTRISIPRDDSDEEDEEDGDLKPYAMEYESDPDEDSYANEKPKVAVPLYLRDLLSYIRAVEDRGKIEVGLKSAAELIRRKAGSLELEEFAEKLAKALVLLSDNFEVPDFYKLRDDAVVALVVTSPAIVSSVLTAQFYKKRISLGQRLNILNALALGAKELSGFDRSPSVPPLSGKPSPATLNNNAATRATSSALVPQKQTFDSITNTIAETRTRRFSQKAHIEASRPAPKTNAFSNLASVFLGGLLGRWGGNRGAGMERGFDALQKAPVVLLKKFVFTLGVMVYYAGNSPHLLPITRELFLFLFALRYHNPPAQTTSKPSAAPPGSSFSQPTLTSLKLPGDIGISARPSTLTSGSGAQSSLSILASSSLPYNPELVESILFALLILLTPSSQTLSDDLLVRGFFAEIGECQQWAMELWEHYKLEEIGSGDKSRMYCAALLQRCFELLEVRI
ncbi:MAG: telomere length regulation protein-domain-containing protein [Benniella sp.]|nr:MAG: telomere length regulation protein-domain-containing protein [Benniella sp.]